MAPRWTTACWPAVFAAGWRSRRIVVSPPDGRSQNSSAGQGSGISIYDAWLLAKSASSVRSSSSSARAAAACLCCNPPVSLKSLVLVVFPSAASGSCAMSLRSAHGTKPRFMEPRHPHHPASVRDTSMCGDSMASASFSSVPLLHGRRVSSNTDTGAICRSRFARTISVRCCRPACATSRWLSISSPRACKAWRAAWRPCASITPMPARNTGG